MARDMTPAAGDVEAFRVKDSRPCQLGVETGPYERLETLGQLGVERRRIRVVHECVESVDWYGGRRMVRSERKFITCASQPRRVETRESMC